MNIPDACPKCRASQYLELDDRHGHYARKCIHGHTNGYVDVRGEETPIRTPRVRYGAPSSAVRE